MRPQYIATKSRTRHYGYTVKDTTGETLYFIGPGCTGGWYKYKRDAQTRADELNRAARRREYPPCICGAYDHKDGSCL